MSIEGDHEPRDAESYFVEALRRAIDKGELSQQAIADRMAERGHRFHQSTIYKILKGERKVTLGEAIDLAAVVDVPLGEMTVPRHEEAMRSAIRWAEHYQRQIRYSTFQMLEWQRKIGELLAARDDWEPRVRRSAELWVDAELAKRAFRAGLNAAADANVELHLAAQLREPQLLEPMGF